MIKRIVEIQLWQAFPVGRLERNSTALMFVNAWNVFQESRGPW